MRRYSAQRPEGRGAAKPAGEQEDADPAAAVRTVEANGFAVVGVPRRKPKHVEILGRDKGGDVELHVEIDGTLRVLANKPNGLTKQKGLTERRTAA